MIALNVYCSVKDRPDALLTTETMAPMFMALVQLYCIVLDKICN
jgi:hypothetical protein